MCVQDIEALQDAKLIRRCDFENGSETFVLAGVAAALVGCAKKIPAGILHDRGRFRALRAVFTLEVAEVVEHRVSARSGEFVEDAAIFGASGDGCTVEVSVI